MNGFGTLTFTCDTRPKKTCEEIYQAYKQRNDIIEVILDSSKNFLKADLMYMQNRYVLEGWLLSQLYRNDCLPQAICSTQGRQEALQILPEGYHRTEQIHLLSSKSRANG